ncbi:hypothetical protein PVK06_043063 [Gossypium arboreum]|uniref:Uncharacterized protein n=1 Tax=Gossypium arboreum TaxID=29729 RepID=A0ABR0MMI7_GOSAR|nr:hypothetical protein PVK06_043063 [Gossypium arboreum]
MLATAPKHKVDVLKLKEFMGMRSARFVDNFLWGMEKYFCAKVPQMRDKVASLLRLRRSFKVNSRGNFIWSMLKITLGLKSLIELVPRKEKFESSKTKETSNGRGNHEVDGNENDKNGGNKRPYNGMWRPNNKPKEPV